MKEEISYRISHQTGGFKTSDETFFLKYLGKGVWCRYRFSRYFLLKTYLSLFQKRRIDGAINREKTISYIEEEIIKCSKNGCDKEGLERKKCSECT